MPFVDHLGSEEVLQDYVEQGIIEPVHIGFLRGRNFADCIVICDEAENITGEIATLIVSRAAENCQIWFLGDETQTDKDIFKRNGGLTHLCSRLKGNKLFGAVRLPKTERSATAELSTLLK